MAYNKNYQPRQDSSLRETPNKLFSLLDKEFNFILDAAATARNSKCTRYISPAMDSFATPWITSRAHGSVWLNPPYSRGMIGRFVEHAVATASTESITVVCLLPADPSTRWWRYHVLGGVNKPYSNISTEIRFLTPRVRFLLDGMPMKGGAMTPNAIVILRGQGGNYGRTTRYWNWVDNLYY